MATRWQVPRIWSGDTVFILAPGPSASQEVADKLRGQRVIVVNDAYKLAPWADILYACDVKWWDYHYETLEFAGLKVTLCKDNYVCKYQEVKFLEYAGPFGLSWRPTHLRTCKNSGFQAMNLACLLGAKKIVLCGFDMKQVKGEEHFFGAHPESLKQRIPFEDFITLITKTAPEFVSAGVQVVNATEGSALKCFNFESLESAVESVRANSVDAAISA